MLTLALARATRPPPSWAEIIMGMTELAFPYTERDREITPSLTDTVQRDSMNTQSYISYNGPSFIEIVYTGTGKALVPTCVFVESKVWGGSSRHCFVCNSAILAWVWVIGRHSDNRCPRSTLCAQTDSITDWVELWSVIVNVNQIYPDIGYWTQSTLQSKQKALLLYLHIKLWTERNIPESGSR